ncbi:MAG: TonB-dependent siderophore receptor [Opitutaceae bacterium]
MRPRIRSLPPGTMFRQLIHLSCLLLSFACILPAYSADAEVKRVFNVPAGPAEQSLKLFSEQSGRGVIFSTDSLKDARTKAVQGEFTAREAIDRMVDGTALVVTLDEKTGAFGIKRDSGPNAERAAQAVPGDRPENRAKTEPRTVGRAAAEDTITLSPFTVNAEADKGYAATSTLAGTRFKTDLKDIAASISVLTSEFLSDIGANNFTEALQYSTSAQLDVGDDSAAGPAPNGNRFQGGPPEFRVRGQPTTQARNYFPLRIETDTYNLERIEDSRGPNSVLFGFGAPGGILNVSTKRARTDRSFKQAVVQAGSFGSHREVIDVNEVLLKGKLALRLNALYDQSNTFQEYAFNRNRRFDLAVKYQVTPTTQLRAEYERAFIKENKPRPFAIIDAGVQLWRQVGSPTLPAATANSALSIARLATARRLTFIGNDNKLIETAGTLTTLDPGNLAPASRIVTDRNLADPSINYGGPGQINKSTANDFSVFLEKKLGRSTFVEVAYNHQDQAGTRANPQQGNFKLWGDPNQFLPAGQPNLHAGQMFIETAGNSWERNVSTFSSNDVRGIVSTEFDAGKWGNFRVAVLGEHDRRGGVGISQREVWAGRPFNANPEANANQVRRRNYVTPGVWNTYFINSPLTSGLIKGAVDPVTGRSLDSTWVARSQSQEDDPSSQKTGMASGQARFFSNRLVVGAGYRYDKLEILDRTAQRDPLTNEWSLAFATEATAQREARNTSFGVVGHLTPKISVFYNRANNQGLAGNQRIIDIRNLSNSITPPTSKGEGNDYGIALTLFDGKIHARATRYTTDALDLTDSYGATGIAPESAAPNILGALSAAGRITPAEQDAHTPIQSGITFAMVSAGYEFNLVANPVKNWRLQANFSYTDTKRTNFGPEIKAWMDREIAYYKSFNQGSLVTGQSSRTIDQAIDFMVASYNSLANIEQIGELGLRKYKVNIFTRYDLPLKVVKGGYIGGGYRHQSRNLAGTDRATTLGYYGKSFWRADLLAGYAFQKSTLERMGRFVKGLTIQLNVNNVFDDDDHLVTRIQPDGDLIWRAIPQAPRTWRLQAKIEF